MGAQRPRSTNTDEASAGELEDGSTEGQTGLDPSAASAATANVTDERLGNDGEERKGTMRGGHDPAEMGRRSAEARRGKASQDAQTLTDDDVRQALLQSIRRKPTPENVGALERWDRMHADHAMSTDPTLPLEEWSEGELERVRARLLAMAERIESRDNGSKSIPARVREGGAPPQSRSPARVEVSRFPPEETEAPPADVDEPLQPGEVRPTTLPTPRQQPGPDAD